MAGGGSNQNQSISQTVSANNLPAWQNQAYQQVASQAFGQAYNPTTGLPNSLPALRNVASEDPSLSNYVNTAGNAPTAGTSLLQNNAFNGYTPNAAAPQAANAYQGYNSNIQANQTPNAFANYQSNVSTTPVSTTNWDNAAAQQYMNPYTNQVLSAQQALAQEQLGSEQAQLQQQAAASGALGGDRAAVAQQQLNHNWNLQQQNLQANALQNAYTTGQQAFNNDANRQLQAGVENSQLGLAAGIQNANLGFGALNSTNQLNLSNNAMALQAAMQNAGLNYGALGAANQVNLANAGYGLQANLQNANLGYNALANTNQLATAGMYGNLYGINEAGQAGQVQQAYNQSLQDNSYNNAMNQYLFPEQQISYSEGVLNGIPNQWIQQNDIYGAQGNPYSQALNAAAQGAAAQTKPSGGGGGGGSSAPPGQLPSQNNGYQPIVGKPGFNPPIVSKVPQPPGLNMPEPPATSSSTLLDSNGNLIGGDVPYQYTDPLYGPNGVFGPDYGLPQTPSYNPVYDQSNYGSSPLSQALGQFSAGGSGDGSGGGGPLNVGNFWNVNPDGSFSGNDQANNFFPSYNPFDATGTEGQGLMNDSFAQYSSLPNYNGYDGMTSPDYNGVSGYNDPYAFV